MGIRYFLRTMAQHANAPEGTQVVCPQFSGHIYTKKRSKFGLKWENDSHLSSDHSLSGCRHEIIRWGPWN